MIGFERSYWQLIGHLPVHRRRLMVGRKTPDADGAYFSTQAILQSRPLVRVSDLAVVRLGVPQLSEQRVQARVC